MRRAAITAVGHYLPEHRLTNEDLEGMVDTSDEWIQSRTGIKERRILKDDDKASSFMGAEAAKEACEKRGISPEELDLIIVGTVTPDNLCPATACLIQERIGATNAWGYDILAACCGYLFTLSTAASFIASGKHDKVMVVGVDKMSSIVDYTDRTTCVIFGDAAGATLLEPAEKGVGIIDSVEHVDGRGAPYLKMDGGGSLHPASHETVDAGMHNIQQDGRIVFKHAVEEMANATIEIMERNDLSAEDIRYLAPHQANRRIIEATANRMDLPMEQVMLNIDRYGNTTAATIPLCLYDYESELKRGDNIILAAFGGGFTWGASFIKWAYDGSQE